MDIDDVFGRTTNALMFEYIKNNLDFDQLIWEFGNDTNPDWIHVSFCSPAENRSRCLRAFKLHGKTHYKEI
jgi:zinc D-Ala-D-Ala carboxypeptidase